MSDVQLDFNVFSVCFAQLIFAIAFITGSPSSKYEHRRTSALLRNVQNIRICLGKKPIVSVTYENERISIKNSLPYLKCVLRLSCVVHGPIYCRFMSFYVNCFLFYKPSLFSTGQVISVKLLLSAYFAQN